MIQYCFMYNIYIIVLCWACCRLRLVHYVANPDYYLDMVHALHNNIVIIMLGAVYWCAFLWLAV